MRSFKEYLYYFIKVSSDRSHRQYYRDYFKYCFDEFEASDHKKDKKTIKHELKVLQKYWNTFPVQYFRYNLYRSDCKLSMEDMKDYIPDFFAFYLFYPQSFKDRNILCEDKKLMHITNCGMKINQPKTLFFTENKGFLSESLDKISTNECMELVMNSEADKIFAKPVFGVGGKGICIFKREEGKYIDKQNQLVLDEKFLEDISGESFIIQEGVKQHAIMNTIYPDSLNTFRIVTEYDNNNVKILFSILRMGSGGNQIDNASSGGMNIAINTENGTLGNIAIANDRSRYNQHPDTGFKFDNYQFPETMWEDIKSFATMIAYKYAPIRYIGWDIAYSENGPVLIEGNNGPGIAIIQDNFGGARKQFKIDNPIEFWYSNNYSLKNL